MLNKIVKYFLSISLVFFLISCTSINTLTINDGYAALENTTSLRNEYFALERDYNPQSKNKSDEYILNLLLTTLSQTLSKNGLEIIESTPSSFTININDIDIDALIVELNTNDDNPIIYKDKDGNVKVNINVDNYLRLSKIVPILNNDTFYSYTAAFNKDTTEDEFVKLISYAISDECAKAMSESTIKVTFNNNDESSKIEFTILDFLLLHKPITN